MVGPNTDKPGWLLDFVLLSAVWGSSFLFMRLAVVEFGALPTALLRAAIGALALLPLVVWRGHAAQAAAQWKPLFVAGILNSSIPTACLSFALLSISSGLTAIVNATVPLFGALLAFLWFRHQPRPLAVAGMVIGLAGVALLAWDKAGFKPGAQALPAALAMLSASLAAFSGAASAHFARRFLPGMAPVALAGGSQVGAALGLVLPALWLWPQQMPGLRAWLAVATVGVLCTGVGYLLFFRVLERAGPARALSVTFVMPLFAMLYGIAFLQEEVTAPMLACAALIVGGTAMSMGMGLRRRSSV